MERSAQKYFAIASLLGMHFLRTQSRLQKAYSFFILVWLTPFNLYSIIKEYSRITKFEASASGGFITVKIFIMFYHITSAVQLVVSFYWLITKSKDFFQLITQIDTFADELSCKEQLVKHIKWLDAIFCYFVAPAFCILFALEVITYGSFEFKMLQLLEDIYVCAVVAIWQWKLIVVASSMRVVISKLNANLEVPVAIFFYFKFRLVTFFLQRVHLHPALISEGHVASLRDSHAELYSMVERISNLFQGILAIASLNIFLCMVFVGFYWAIGVYDLDPAYSHKRLVVAMESSGLLIFTIFNYFLFVRSCELAVFEVSAFVHIKICEI